MLKFANTLEFLWINTLKIVPRNGISRVTKLKRSVAVYWRTGEIGMGLSRWNCVNKAKPLVRNDFAEPPETRWYVRNSQRAMGGVLEYQRDTLSLNFEHRDATGACHKRWGLSRATCAGADFSQYNNTVITSRLICKIHDMEQTGIPLLRLWHVMHCVADKLNQTRY